MGFPTHIFRALPPYLGGKRRLAPLIFALLQDLVPRPDWPTLAFLDPMCGGGAVALAAKALGFNVTAGDGSCRGTTVAHALIANSTTRLTEHDIVRFLSEVVPSERHEISDNDLFSSLFTEVTTNDEPLRYLFQLVLIKAYLRSFPMSLPSASDAQTFQSGDFDRITPRRLGTYMNARKLLTPAGLWHIAKQVNSGVFGGPGTALQGDALEVIQSVPADVVYLDPPYAGTTGYRESYQNLDRLLGDSTETQAPSLVGLLEVSNHIPLVIISYGGPDVTAESVAEIVSKHRTVVRALDVSYPHLASIATTKRKSKTREVIIIAER